MTDPILLSIEGAVAKRFARGDEEVTVRVKLPESELDTDVLEPMAFALAAFHPR